MQPSPGARRISATGDLDVPAGRGLPHGLTIPAAELVERFSRSSGPGGQSVNTADSRVELLWDVASSAVLDDRQRARLLSRLGTRVTGGVLTISSSEHRAQLRNRIAARGRLAHLVAEALAPVPPRRATRPSRAAKQARLDAKRRRGELKANRRLRED